MCFNLALLGRRSNEFLGLFGSFILPQPPSPAGSFRCLHIIASNLNAGFSLCIDFLCSSLGAHSGSLSNGALIIMFIRWWIIVFDMPRIGLLYPKYELLFTTFMLRPKGCWDLKLRDDYIGIQVREELESKGCQIRTACEVVSVSTTDDGVC